MFDRPSEAEQPEHPATDEQSAPQDDAPQAMETSPREVSPRVRRIAEAVERHHGMPATSPTVLDACERGVALADFDPALSHALIILGLNGDQPQE